MVNCKVRNNNDTYIGNCCCRFDLEHVLRAHARRIAILGGNLKTPQNVELFMLSLKYLSRYLRKNNWNKGTFLLLRNKGYLESYFLGIGKRCTLDYLSKQ